MADTQKTISDLLTALFPDGQADSSITPQDMRDLIVSLGQVPFGGIFTLVSAETIIGTTGLYVKVLGTTQINNLRNMDMPVDNRLRYLGTVPYHVHIACTLSTTSAGNNNLVSFKLFFYDDSVGSGALIDGSQVNRFIATGADEGTTALHWDLVMGENDYLELHVANRSNTDNITVTNFYIFGVGMSI